MHRAVRANQEALVRLLLARFPDFSIFTRNEREESVLDVAETEPIKDMLKRTDPRPSQIRVDSIRVFYRIRISNSAWLKLFFCLMQYISLLGVRLIQPQERLIPPKRRWR